MWSSNASSTSDSKKNEDSERCECSGVAAETSNSSDRLTQKQLQKQQLNIFEDNNKQRESQRATKIEENQKEIVTSEAEDSGFISGPQSSLFSSDQDVRAEYKDSGINSTNNFKTGSSENRTHRKEEKSILDSGCIDEYSPEAEEEQESEAQKQQIPSSALNNKMLLKQNVDAGMSEWFCNLSLQNQGTSSRTVQSQPLVSGLNNLGAASGRKSNSAVSTTLLDHKHKQHQQHKIGKTTPNSTTPIITPSTAWEQFYQQDDDGDTPLHLACISGFADVVAALIRMAPHPCLFNIQNDQAQTPLHLAALTTQPKILRMLLIAGAEPTMRDRNGNTALHLACMSGEEQCVRALTIPISASEINEAHRQYGHRSNDKTVSYLKCASLPSDLEIRNYDGERCVHLAAQAGHIDILRILVLYGADINAREGKSGCTPLHIAIECCNEDLANFLLDECQKLNLEAPTYAGLTAYQVACILNKSQMQNILEKRGAEPLTPPDSDYDSESDIESDLEDTKVSLKI